MSSFCRRLQVLRQSERARDTRRAQEKKRRPKTPPLPAATYLFGLEPMPEGALEGEVPDSRSEPVLPSPSPPDLPPAPGGSD